MVLVSIFFIWFQVYSFFGADTVSIKYKICDTYTHKWIVDNSNEKAHQNTVIYGMEKSVWLANRKKNHYSPVFISGWRVLRVMVDRPPIENKGVGYINGNALISYFDILQTTKNERSINNRLNIALQRIHNNLIAESPVPGAPPVDQSENLVSRSGSLRIRWCQSGS